MRFKRIIFAVALATLIKAGVALSGDDGKEYMEYFDPLPCIYSDYGIIVSDIEYFPYIAEAFEGNCVPLSLRSRVYSRFLNVDDDNDDDNENDNEDDDKDESSLLSAVNEAFEITFPTSALVCKSCADDGDYFMMSATTSLAYENNLDFYYIKTMIDPETQVTGFKLKHIYELFPSGPGKGACKIAAPQKSIPVE